MAYAAGSPFFDIFEIPKDDKIFQGDIIQRKEDECDFFEGQEQAVGYLIVSNSCDIINGNIEFISLVPIYPFFKAIEPYIETFKSEFRKIDKTRSFKKEGYIKKFENIITDIINKEANYNGKSTFLISPLEAFDSMPTLATIEDVRSIPIDEKNKKVILKYRICSLKGPWREKLGYKVAYLYNRVATDAPLKDEINIWWKEAYVESYTEVIDILPK